MELKVFEKSFPNFPLDEKSFEKFQKLLIEKNILTEAQLSKIKAENKTPNAIFKAIALMPYVQPEVLAEIEAEILGCPYINLMNMQISKDIYKLVDENVLKKKFLIPIKMNGSDLLIGTVSPADTEQLKGLHPTFIPKPAKVLPEPLEKKLKEFGGPEVRRTDPRTRKCIGDVLVGLKYLSEADLTEALEGAKNEKLRLGSYLVKKSKITNKQLCIALSEQFGLPFMDLDESLVDPILGTLIPQKLCQDAMVCPVKKEGKILTLAMLDPTDIITIDHIEMMTGLRVSVAVSSEFSIERALSSIYGESMDMLSDEMEGNSEDELTLNLTADDAPIIKLVNLILTQAVTRKVSDIHIELYENSFRIRFREDGTLKTFMEPARSAHAALVSRIKVMANLDIAETRRPQDGRIKFDILRRKVDLRVSCIPCVWGEKVVMRLLDQRNLKVDLNDLGFEPFVLETFMEGVRQPNGVVLVTGPTGSGKTTTLYSSLFLLNNPTQNIMTAEDPVEYNLKGINQVQCHTDIGLDFAAALRSFLRQDPDVIMLGEIRDYETANIAIKAALTGHLVISTLHTNDAPSTVARLLNMGIEPFSLSSSLRVVQAQRLVRKNCLTCSSEFTPDRGLLQSLAIDEKLLKKLRLDDKFTMDNLVFKKGAGCPDCDGVGTKGRMGIYEVLNVTSEMRDAIENKATTEDMRRLALAQGMLSLRESALYKLINGITSVEEVVGTTMAEDITEGDEEGATQVGKPQPPKHRQEPQETPAEITLQTPSETSATEIAGIQNLSEELKNFSGVLAKAISMGTSRTEQDSHLDETLLRKSISDPLNAINKLTATKADAGKVLPAIAAQGQKIQHNVDNLVRWFSDFDPAIKKVKLDSLAKKFIFAKAKTHLNTAKLLTGNKKTASSLKLAKRFADLPPVAVDIEAFDRIASNLFVNALTAIGEKPGEIQIITRISPKNDKYAQIIFVDNGSGIPKEKTDQIFAPFQGANGSLGLGLAVSKKLTEKMDGKIQIQSEPGKKTLVTLELPLANN